MSIDVLLNKLEKVKRTGDNKWLACCPAHEDREPSLAIQQNRDGRILIHCFALCGAAEVMNAIGLSLMDLFPNGALGEFESWEKTKRRREANQQKKHEAQQWRDEAFLTLAKGKRAQGERLTQAEMTEERNAYLRLKNANHLGY